MIYIDIPQKKKTLYFPEELAECDEKQYLGICKLLYHLNAGQITYPEFRVLAVYVLLNMKWNKKTYKTEGFIPEADQQKWENIFRLSEKVDAFFEKKTNEDGDEQYIVKHYFIKNHVPKYWMFRSYYGPADAFENVLFGQYLDGLEEFIYYSQSGDSKALRNLFAIFYLPKNEKYNRRKSLRRATGILKHVDIRFLYGFYIYFWAMHEYMMSGSVTIMGQEIDLSIIYKEVTKTEIKSTVPGIGWMSTAQDIAESGVFGTYENVRNTEMWPILMRLYDLKKRAIDDKVKEDADNAKAKAKSAR